MARKRLTAEKLRKLGIKELYIPGILFVTTLGSLGAIKAGIEIHKYKSIYPTSAVVRTVLDGDTVELYNTRRVRLVGINAPDRGEIGYEQATQKLQNLVEGKKVYLEYDRYEDDQAGRTLAWIWINCVNPKFTKADYMFLSYNRSREGLKDNPKGCEKGKLVQEELIKSGNAKVEVYKDRGELKYEERIRKLDTL